MMRLRHLVHKVARRAASDAKVREKATQVAQDVMQKSRQIAKEDDPAYAAGQAVRRAFDKLRNSK